MNWQWHLMSKTNIHLTHTGANLHSRVFTAAKILPKYQKQSTQNSNQMSKAKLTNSAKFDLLPMIT